MINDFGHTNTDGQTEVSDMKSNDYVKYITQTFVKYIDQPKDERKKLKEEQKGIKEPFLFRWFGVFPYVMASLFKKKH
jgi:hypothetical protein